MHHSLMGGGGGAFKTDKHKTILWLQSMPLYLSTEQYLLQKKHSLSVIFENVCVEGGIPLVPDPTPYTISFYFIANL